MRMIFRHISWVAIARVNLRAEPFGKILKGGKSDRRTVSQCQHELGKAGTRPMIVAMEKRWKKDYAKEELSGFAK